VRRWQEGLITRCETAMDREVRYWESVQATSSKLRRLPPFPGIKCRTKVLSLYNPGDVYAGMYMHKYLV